MVLENKIDRFIGKVEMGVTFFTDAAALLVQMIDEEPDVCDRIASMRRVGWLTLDVLHTFEAIGRKQLAVETMFLPKHVLQRMVTLPVDQQVEISKAEVPIFQSSSGRHSTDLKVVKRKVRDFSPKDAAIAIGPTGIRTLEEQRAYIEQPAPAEKIIGYYELTVMNGKPFLKMVERSARAQRVTLDMRSQAVLELAMPE